MFPRTRTLTSLMLGALLVLGGCGGGGGGGGDDPETPTGSGTLADPYILNEGVTYEFEIPPFLTLIATDDVYFRFVPQSTAFYTAELSGMNDLQFELRTAGNNFIAECDNNDNADTETCNSEDIGVQFNAGTTYLISVFNFGNDTDTATFRVTQN